MRMNPTRWKLPEDWQARRKSQADLRPTKEMLETCSFADCKFLVGDNDQEKVVSMLLLKHTFAAYQVFKIFYLLFAAH